MNGVANAPSVAVRLDGVLARSGSEVRRRGRVRYTACTGFTAAARQNAGKPDCYGECDAGKPCCYGGCDAGKPDCYGYQVLPRQGFAGDRT
jgi:hypothetical protein